MDGLSRDYRAGYDRAKARAQELVPQWVEQALMSAAEYLAREAATREAVAAQERRKAERAEKTAEAVLIARKVCKEGDGNASLGGDLRALRRLATLVLELLGEGGPPT